MLHFLSNNQVAFFSLVALRTFLDIGKYIEGIKIEFKIKFKKCKQHNKVR